MHNQRGKFAVRVKKTSVMQHKKVHNKALKKSTASTYPNHDHASHPRKTRKDKTLSASSNCKTQAVLSLMV